MRSLDAASEPLRLTSEGEAVWQQLRQQVEWAQGFALIFLFSSDPAVVFLYRERLRDAQRLRISDLEIQQPGSPDALVEEVLERARHPSERYQSLHAPWWVEMYRHPRDAAWDEARRSLLARLNERRDLLRRTLRRPLILILPQDFNRETQDTAPDLWSIRDFSEILRFRAVVEQAAPERLPSQGGAPEPAPGRDASGHPLVKEWRRLLSKVDHVRSDQRSDLLRTGWQASDTALARGDLELAWEIAGETLVLAREAGWKTLEALRDLSISLNKLGDVASQRGDLGTAEQHYQESLAIARDLAERLQTPQALRDLSISLNKLGDVAQLRGDLATAELHYQESLALARAVAEQLKTPQAQWSLSNSLEKAGDLALQQGDLSTAEQFYQESLALRRSLAEQVKAPQTLRSLAMVLIRLGTVAWQRRDWSTAEEHYQTGLALARAVAEQLKTAHALRDLGLVLDRAGAVAQNQGKLDAVEEYSRESLELAGTLAEQYKTPGALRDLSVSLERVGDLVQQRGDLSTAEQHYLESLKLRRTVAEQQETPEALRDLSDALSRLGEVALQRGDRSIAEAAYQEALELASRLAHAFPELKEYAQFEQHLRTALQRLADTPAAKSAAST
jgi:tetratricopeptide (TPR) repeat protein